LFERETLLGAANTAQIAIVAEASDDNKFGLL
jgi:hypothetical protein